MAQTLSRLRIVARKLIVFGRTLLTSAGDFCLYVIPRPPLRLDVPEKARVVVYLGGNLPPRIARIAKWLKRTGPHYTVLVCHQDGFRQKYSNDALDRVILFRNRWHLKKILLRLKRVDLIHAFGPKSMYPAAALKASPAPFIYDMQDVLVVYYGLHPPIRWYRGELPHEKYCLSHADGFIAHSLEFQEAVRLYGIRDRKPKNLFFPLGVDDDVMEDKKGSFDPSNIQIVYIGEVAGSFRDSRQFATIQFHTLARQFAEQGMHLHLYPAPGTFADDINEYRDLARTNPFLHIHDSVHQSALAGELSRYDFGLIPFFFRDTIHSWEKFKYSTSLKLFNYIEAGIPVICSRDIVFQCWIVERYGLGIGIDKEELQNLRNSIARSGYDRLLKSIQENRRRLCISSHIQRVSRFYDEIMRGRN